MGVRKMKIIIEDNLDFKETKKIFSFAKQYCDKFSMEGAGVFGAKIEKNEFERLQKELQIYFCNEDKERRRKYKEDKKYHFFLKEHFGFGTESAVNEYFDGLKKQDFECLNDITYEMFINNSGTYEIFHPDFLYRTISFIGVIGVGGAYCNCYFKVRKVFDEIFNKKKYLFDYDWFHEEQYMNLIMYTEDNRILAIYNELYEAELNLNEEQYKEFTKLNIKHKVNGGEKK